MRPALKKTDRTIHAFISRTFRTPQSNHLLSALQNEKIDIFINNAATFAPDGPGPLMLPDVDEFTRVMRVNAVAPVIAGGIRDCIQ